MAKQVAAQPTMLPVKMITKDGAYICNVRTSDLSAIEAKESGISVVIHCAIRLDAMHGELYELYETKEIEVSSIDFCRPIQGNVLQFTGKGRLTLCEKQEGRQ